ncbi:hypothetical protein K438DRAFT_1997113 [Mycena galopus ATCC 62051]|nr:hypothetical protein K438DRAFT_1997113 [Mycena galopus ATCC 62051]
MGKPWTADAEKMFLLSKFPAYVTASAGPKKTTQRTQDVFFNKLNAEFLVLFPARDDLIEQRKAQLKTWMRYRDSTRRCAAGAGARGTGCRGKTSLFEALIPLKSTRPLRAVEVYQKMYGPMVRAEVARRTAEPEEKAAKAKFLAELVAACEVRVLSGQELKDTVEKDEESQHESKKDERRWAMSLWRRVVTSMHEGENAEVKATVREWMVVLNMARSLGMQDVEEEEERTPKQFQHVINQLVDVVNQVLKTIYEKTGWHCCFLGGGPMPDRAGQVICYSTSPNGNDFQASHEDFNKAVKAPFASYLKRAFPSEVRSARALGPDLSVKAGESATSLDGLLTLDPMVTKPILLVAGKAKTPAPGPWAAPLAPVAPVTSLATALPLAPPALAAPLGPSPPAHIEAPATPLPPWMPSAAFTAALQKARDDSDSDFPCAGDYDNTDYGSTASSYDLSNTWADDSLFAENGSSTFTGASASQSPDTMSLMGASSSATEEQSTAKYTEYNLALGQDFNIDERGEVIPPVAHGFPALQPVHRGSSFALDQELGADPGRERHFVLPEASVYRPSTYFEAFKSNRPAPTAPTLGMGSAFSSTTDANAVSQGISSVASTSPSKWIRRPSPYRPRVPNAPAPNGGTPRTLEFLKSVVGNIYVTAQACIDPYSLDVYAIGNWELTFCECASPSGNPSGISGRDGGPSLQSRSSLFTSTLMSEAGPSTAASGVVTTGIAPPSFESQPMANPPPARGRGRGRGGARGARGGGRGAAHRHGGGVAGAWMSGGEGEAAVGQERGDRAAPSLTGDAAVAETARIHREEAALRETRDEMLRRSKAVAAAEKRLKKLCHNPARGAPLVLVTQLRSSRVVKTITNGDGSLRPVVTRRGDMSTSTVTTSVDRNTQQAAADDVLLKNLRKQKAPEGADEADKSPK